MAQCPGLAGSVTETAADRKCLLAQASLRGTVALESGEERHSAERPRPGGVEVRPGRGDKRLEDRAALGTMTAQMPEQLQLGGRVHALRQQLACLAAPTERQPQVV